MGRNAKIKKKKKQKKLPGNQKHKYWKTANPYRFSFVVLLACRGSFHLVGRLVKKERRGRARKVASLAETYRPEGRVLRGRGKRITRLSQSRLRLPRFLNRCLRLGDTGRWTVNRRRERTAKTKPLEEF